MQYRTKDKDMLDAICWKHYNRQSGAVEAVLEANPGLADFGTVMPAGLLIELPELSDSNNTTVTLRLWD
jgi:phage tail protein X